MPLCCFSSINLRFLLVHNLLGFNSLLLLSSAFGLVSFGDVADIEYQLAVVSYRRRIGDVRDASVLCRVSIMHFMFC